MLTCEALSTTQERFAFTAFDRAFTEFGLPQAIRKLHSADDSIRQALGEELEPTLRKLLASADEAS